MPHQLEQSRFDLPDISDWYAGDSRVLAFVVVNDAGAVDLTDADISWRLFGRAYHDADADAILSGDDAGVELVTDDRVDSESGEFEVRIDADATVGRWGIFWHRPTVTQSDGTSAQWRGKIVLTA